MPGFAGFIGEELFALGGSPVAAMAARLRHEPFYQTGGCEVAALGVRVGTTSIPGSFASGQPFWNAAGTVCLVFAGEHFGGAAAGAHSAAALLRRYEECGEAFVGELNGCFAGLVLDVAARRAWLFNDRYGFGRVYVHESAGGVWFATEAKALLAVLPECRRIDPRGLGEWLSCGCVLQDRTLFDGISLLPGGSLWCFRPGEPVDRRSYFGRGGWEDQDALGEQAFDEALHETLGRRVPLYLAGDRPVGMSLTGGLDGKMVMAALGAAGGALPCYTFGGMLRDCLDVRMARRNARACGCSHTVLPVDGAFLRDFAGLAAKAVHVSDGEMDVSGSVELFVNRLARGVAPVRLTGNYGSEIVRRHVAFRPLPPAAALVHPDLQPQLDAAAATYAAEAVCHPLSFVAFKQVPWHHHARLSVEQSQLCVRSPFLDVELVRLMYRAPAAAQRSAEPSLRVIARNNPRLARIPTDRGVVYPPVPVLTAARRRVEETLAKVEYAFDYGMPQSIARSVGRLMPVALQRRFLGRQKFYHFRTWYQRELAGTVREILLDPATLGRSWFRREWIERMVAEHTGGTGNHTREIHRVMTVELIHRELLES